MSSLRVLSWNLMYPTIGDGRCAAILDLIAASGADLICLQECPPDLTAYLADRLGVHAHSDGGDTAVLSHLDVVARDVVELPGATAAAMTVKSPRGRLWAAMSAHLSWGGHQEGTRLSQAGAIGDAIDSATPTTVRVLAGDLNCTPDSATVRYLTGLDPRGDGTSTLWVDAWASCGSGDGTTVRPGNPLAAQTARAVGIVDPMMLPDRRIDYVLVHGWVYGRPGCPVSVRVVGPEMGSAWPSDHYAVMADCWDPDLD